MITFKQKINVQAIVLIMICFAFALIPIIAFGQNVQNENLESTNQNEQEPSNEAKLFYNVSEDNTMLQISSIQESSDFIEATVALNSKKLMDVPWHNKAKDLNNVNIIEGQNLQPSGMAYWFYGMENVTSINGVELIDMSKVETVCNLFGNCKSLDKSITVNFIGNNLLNDTSCMFYGCMNLERISIIECDSNKITDAHSMFEGCIKAETIYSPSLITAKATNMSSMFRCCYALNSIAGSESFITTNVTNMSKVFDGCHSLENISPFINYWTTSSVTDFSGMFAYTSIKYFAVSNFDTASATTMESMFEGCKFLDSVDLSSLNTENVTNFANMFSGCEKLKNIDLDSFNTSNATTLLCMFSGCSALENIDISGFDTSNVTNMNRMFENCTSLSQIDLSDLNTPNLTQTTGMFDSCKNLEEIKFGSFNTSKVENMAHMFFACQKLKNIDLSGFDTTNVWNYASMFEQCISLTMLDLGNFNTQNAKSFETTFSDCVNLETLKLSENFVTDNVQYDNNMFLHCYKIKGEKGTEYSEGHVNKEYARIDMGAQNPGYGTWAVPPVPDPISPEPANKEVNAGIAQTGDGTQIALLGLVAMLGALSCVVLFKRKEQN